MYSHIGSVFICWFPLMQIRELGRGQFGSVWMAKWLGVEVAIKELLGQNTPRARAEMYGEAEMLAALKHPCVIAIYGLVINQASCDQNPLCQTGSQDQSPHGASQSCLRCGSLSVPHAVGDRRETWVPCLA